MFDFRIRGIRVALHFGSGVGYGACGAVGQMMVESSGFREKTGVSTPLLNSAFVLSDYNITAGTRIPSSYNCRFSSSEQSKLTTSFSVVERIS